MKKTFYTMNNIGKSKYTVSHHDGTSTHSDGSPFFGISIFKNKKKRDQYIRELKRQGYTERGYGNNPRRRKSKSKRCVRRTRKNSRRRYYSRRKR